MTVSQMLESMSSKEISEWIAFDSLKDAKYESRLKSEMMTVEQQKSLIIKMLNNARDTKRK